MRGIQFIETLIQDLRYAFRQFSRNRGFTMVSILVLALGIGANTAMYSVVDAVLLRPLPYRKPNQLVIIWRGDLQGSIGRGGTISYPDFLDYRHQNNVFAWMAAFRSNVDFTLTGVGEAARLRGAVVSADLFQLLGKQPVLGRSFLPTEDKPPTTGFPVVLSHRLWESMFESDAAILGRRITLNREPFTVVGVMPAGFQFPIQTEPVDLWTTMAYDVAHMNMPPHSTTDRDWRYLDAVGRLKAGTSIQSAQAEMETVAGHLAGAYPSTNKNDGVWLEPLAASVAGDLRPVLLILLCAAGVVLLIACVDLANLSLARLAARSSLGAGGRRLARQLLTESTLLAIIGAGFGLLIAWPATSGLIRFSPHEIPRTDHPQFDSQVFGFAFALALATGVISGLAPAFRISRAKLMDSLKESWHGATSSRSSTHRRGTLVVAEFALSAMLLVGAGLLIRSLWRLVHVNPGFEPQHAATFKIDLPETPYKGAARTEFVHDLLDRVRSLPGVKAAGGVDFFPFGGLEYTGKFQIAGIPPGPQRRGGAAFCLVTPDYFPAMGIPLLKGRAFNRGDRRGSLPVVIISRSLADRYFSSQNPLGRQLILDTPVNVVGVTGDVKNGSLAAGVLPAIYIPLAQQPINPPAGPRPGQKRANL